MPSIRVVTGQLPAQAKAAIGESFSTAVHSLLNVGMVEVFFEEQELYFINGKAAYLDHVTLSMEGPDMEEGTRQTLCEELCKLYRESTGMEDVHVTFVYHPNQPGYVGTNGQLHSLRSPRNA